jgi:DNA invertase Pin-like site-specific DNA recombinase
VKVLGYVRVSTDEQAAGLRVQEATIRSACVTAGYELAGFVTDEGFSAKDLNRPGIADALERLKAGGADALMVSKLDRLSRSVFDFAGLVERSRSEGWALICLDLGVDTSTAAGEVMANVLAAFAQFERRLIGERTKAALAVKKAEGVQIGRPRSVSPVVVSLIADLRKRGLGYTAVAAELNNRRVPPARSGAKWWPSTVRAVCRLDGV